MAAQPMLSFLAGMGMSMDMGKNSSETPFCMTEHHAMIMYMDGFHQTLQGGHPCLNLFFAHWTLNTRGKFAGALLLVFAMAIAVEGMSKLRRRVVLQAKKAHSSSSYYQQQQQPPQQFADDHDRTPPPRRNWLLCCGSSSTACGTTSTPLLLRLAVTFIHGLQALSGYLLMLATMTFSLELLIAVVVGLATGYVVFFQLDEHDQQQQQQHVTSNPCCNFMDDEAREIVGLSHTSSSMSVANNNNNNSRRPTAPPQSSSSDSTPPLGNDAVAAEIIGV